MAVKQDSWEQFKGSYEKDFEEEGICSYATLDAIWHISKHLKDCSGLYVLSCSLVPPNFSTKNKTRQAANHGFC